MHSAHCVKEMYKAHQRYPVLKVSIFFTCMSPRCLVKISPVLMPCVILGAPLDQPRD